MKSTKQREARNRELRAVRKLDQGFSCQGLVGEFISVYIQSEVFAKKLQHYYRLDTDKSGKNEIQITILKAAINHFNIAVSEEDVSKLFKGGPGKRGKKSARQLRNGYLHNLSSNDKNEIELKYKIFIPISFSRAN